MASVPYVICNCPKCAHYFIVAHYPIEMTALTKLMRQTRCPICAQSSKGLFWCTGRDALEALAVTLERQAAVLRDVLAEAG